MIFVIQKIDLFEMFFYNNGIEGDYYANNAEWIFSFEWQCLVGF